MTFLVKFLVYFFRNCFYKFFPFLLIFSLFSWQSINEKKQLSLNPEQEYFLEICFNNEFDGPYKTLHKWKDDLKIFVLDNRYSRLNKALDKIISELNQLSNSIKLCRVNDQKEANFLIYFGDQDTYVRKYEPRAKGLTKYNWGLFYIDWNAQQEIYRGNMYVDIFRSRNFTCQRHLIREELTQALGMMNDSEKYKNSIFYQKYTCFDRYSELDKKIIRAFLSDKVKAGMGKNQVLELIKL